MNENIKLIYDLFMAYLPVIASVVTCLVTFIKVINCIKQNKLENTDFSKQLMEIKEANDQTIKENKEFKKFIQKKLDRTIVGDDHE